MASKNYEETLNNEEYNAYKGEILESPDSYYMFANEPLARGFYRRLQTEYPASTLFIDDGAQYICLNAMARAEPVTKLKERQKQREKELRQLRRLIKTVESSGTYTRNDLVYTEYDGANHTLYMEMADGAKFDSNLYYWTEDDLKKLATDENFLDSESNFNMALENAKQREKG